MPIPPAQAPANVRNVLYTTNDTGPTRPPNPVTTASAILPVPLAPQLLGVDAAQFSVTFDGSSTVGDTTVTFPALPQRNNTINPLSLVSASGVTLNIQPKDFMLFTALTQDVTVDPAAVVLVSPQPQAIDINNLRVVGPFLGSNTLRTFQAVITVTVPSGFVGTVTGFVVGSLYLSIG